MDQPTRSLGADELEALFKFIPSGQLLGLRQVSQVCNEASLPVLRKRRDLNFTLTEDAHRNKKFLEFLRTLPGNGFVSSGMKLKFKDELVGRPEEEFAVTEGSSFNPFQEDLAAICNILGAGRDVKKLSLEFQLIQLVNARRLISSELLLRMIGHLSPSLEILDLEDSCLDFTLSQEAEDSMQAFFRNSPLNKLKKIVPPSVSHIGRMSRANCFNAFDKLLTIIVQSAPKLVEDPTTECRRINQEESWPDDDSTDGYSSGEEYAYGGMRVIADDFGYWVL